MFWRTTIATILILMLQLGSVSAVDWIPLAGTNQPGSWRELQRDYNPVGFLYSGIVERCQWAGIEAPSVVEDNLFYGGETTNVVSTNQFGVATNDVPLYLRAETFNAIGTVTPQSNYSGVVSVSAAFLNELDDCLIALVPYFVPDLTNMTEFLQTQGTNGTYIKDVPNDNAAWLFNRHEIGMVSNVTSNAWHMTGGTVYFTEWGPSTNGVVTNGFSLPGNWQGRLYAEAMDERLLVLDSLQYIKTTGTNYATSNSLPFMTVWWSSVDQSADDAWEYNMTGGWGPDWGDGIWEWGELEQVHVDDDDPDYGQFTFTRAEGTPRIINGRVDYGVLPRAFSLYDNATPVNTASGLFHSCSDSFKMALTLSPSNTSTATWPLTRKCGPWGLSNDGIKYVWDLTLNITITNVQEYIDPDVPWLGKQAYNDDWIILDYDNSIPPSSWTPDYYSAQAVDDDAGALLVGRGATNATVVKRITCSSRDPVRDIELRLFEASVLTDWDYAYKKVYEYVFTTTLERTWLWATNITDSSVVSALDRDYEWYTYATNAPYYVTHTQTLNSVTTTNLTATNYTFGAITTNFVCPPTTQYYSLDNTEYETQTLDYAVLVRESFLFASGTVECVAAEYVDAEVYGQRVTGLVASEVDVSHGTTNAFVKSLYLLGGVPTSLFYPEWDDGVDGPWAWDATDPLCPANTLNTNYFVLHSVATNTDWLMILSDCATNKTAAMLDRDATAPYGSVGDEGAKCWALSNATWIIDYPWTFK